MSQAEFEEKAREKRAAMINCSMAILETIRSYGFAATLNLVVRLSNHDPIVSELLPLFPSIARAAMPRTSNIRPGLKIGAGDSEDPIPESELLKTLADGEQRSDETNLKEERYGSNH